MSAPASRRRLARLLLVLGLVLSFALGGSTVATAKKARKQYTVGQSMAK